MAKQPHQLFDVAIVGASVAGASLAVHLGKLGFSVALIEKSEFPRRKACGEGLSDIALEALFRLGVSQSDIDEMRPKSFFAYRLDLGNKSLRFAGGKEDLLKGIGIQRYFLDTVLLQLASNGNSVTSLSGAAVTSYRKNDDSFHLTLKSGETVDARYLVLADGANSPGATRLGIPKSVNRQRHWGISFSLEGSYSRDSGEILILLKEGFEVYCTPVSDTILNVALLTVKENMRRLQDTTLLDELLAEATQKSFFKGGTEERPLQVGPIGARRPYYHGKILLLGDAAESFDPISGLGMTQGLLMAELAAEALQKVLSEKVPVEEAFDHYAAESAKMSRPMRGFTRVTATLLRTPGRRYLLPIVSSTRIPFYVRKALSDRRPAICNAFLKIAGF